MHEALSTNGTAHPMSEADAPDMAQLLEREVIARSAAYEQARAARLDVVRRKLDGEARVKDAKKKADAAAETARKAKERYESVRDEVKAGKAALDDEHNAAKANEAEALRQLRKRQDQLNTELSERTPRAVTP